MHKRNNLFKGTLTQGFASKLRSWIFYLLLPLMLSACGVDIAILYAACVTERLPFCEKNHSRPLTIAFSDTTSKTLLLGENVTRTATSSWNSTITYQSSDV